MFWDHEMFTYFVNPQSHFGSQVEVTKFENHFFPTATLSRQPPRGRPARTAASGGRRGQWARIQQSPDDAT